jgi:hypothetical protein
MARQGWARLGDVLHAWRLVHEIERTLHEVACIRSYDMSLQPITKIAPEPTI